MPRLRKKTFNKIENIIISVPRWALRIILLVLIAPFVLGFLRNCQGNIEPPPVDQAPWVVQTYIYTDFSTPVPSRYYFGEYYSTNNGVPTLKGYWDFDGRTFEYHDSVIEFPPSKYGPVDIVRRK